MTALRPAPPFTPLPRSYSLALALARRQAVQQQHEQHASERAAQVRHVADVERPHHRAAGELALGLLHDLRVCW